MVGQGADLKESLDFRSGLISQVGVGQKTSPENFTDLLGDGLTTTNFGDKSEPAHLEVPLATVH
jgi:hypothetical protein